MTAHKHKCGANVIVRSFHTFLCIGVPLTLMLKDTKLSRSLIHLDNLVFGICYIILLSLSLCMYYLACFIDPGYIPLKPMKKGNNNNSSDDEDDDDDVSDVEDDNIGDENRNMIDGECVVKVKDLKKTKYRICDYCEIQQPMRAKHCEDCNRCVRKYDHHCPWLEACVGERNHKYFLLFLMSTSALIFWTTYITWTAIQYKIEWLAWLQTNVIFIIDMFVLFFGGIVVLGLLCFHGYLMFRGMTTWEAASRERITYLKYLDDEYNPFDEGLCVNMYHFLCGCRVRDWEHIYSKKAHGKDGGMV